MPKPGYRSITLREDLFKELVSRAELQGLTTSQLIERALRSGPS